MKKFTEDENKFIDWCFNTERVKIHFLNDPKRRDNITDIRTVINYRNYNVGTIGIPNHKLMHSIFEKMGYCRDGKTTLKEKEKEKEAKKEAERKAWGIEKKKMLRMIEKKRKELNNIEIEINNHDKSFEKVIEEKKIIAQDAFSKKMTDERKESRDKLTSNVHKSVDSLSYNNLRAMAKEKKIENYGKMKKVDLIESIKNLDVPIVEKPKEPEPEEEEEGEGEEEEGEEV